ncbi:MAG: hypothetical protein OXN17_04990 [Candidatus Poribacteria bacterium]|nr:hypothetical protein [Candidatus Poribacteria bacterium]MDE0505677.1 hypothetical protein [Candidatus Poribacteria bacterium]
MLCPNCKHDSIKTIDEDKLFCLDCDWDNMSELSEIELATPGAPFLADAIGGDRPGADVLSSRAGREGSDGVPYGSPIRIEAPEGERSLTIRFSALTVSVE